MSVSPWTEQWIRDWKKCPKNMRKISLWQAEMFAWGRLDDCRFAFHFRLRLPAVVEAMSSCTLHEHRTMSATLFEHVLCFNLHRNGCDRGMEKKFGVFSIRCYDWLGFSPSILKILYYICMLQALPWHGIQFHHTLFVFFPFIWLKWRCSLPSDSFFLIRKVGMCNA